MLELKNVSYVVNDERGEKQILKNVNAAKKALVVTAENNANVIKSASNIEGVATATVNTINVYDILKYDSFIITTDAVKKVEEVYA